MLRKHKGLVAGVLLLILAVILSVCWWYYHGYVEWCLFALNLVPGTLVLGVHWLTSRLAKAGRMRWSAVARGVGIAVTLSVLFFVWGFNKWGWWTGHVEAVHRYEAVLRHGYCAPYASHFPARIPDEATDVQFHYHPSFWQGGSNLQLGYNLPHSSVQAVMKKHLAHAKQVTDGNKLDSSDEKDRLPTTYFYVGPRSGDGRLPPDFKLLVLDAESDPPGGDWNNGHSAGVAISLTRNEVIYWADNW